MQQINMSKFEYSTVIWWENGWDTSICCSVPITNFDLTPLNVPGIVSYENALYYYFKSKLACSCFQWILILVPGV